MLLTRLAFALLGLGSLAACGTVGDDARYRFGVSATEPGPTVAPTTLPAADLMAWKANQICTLGYRVVSQDDMVAIDGGHIADTHLQCLPYRPSIGPYALNWPSLF